MNSPFDQDSPPPGKLDISEEAVQNQLNQIFASDRFAHSARLKSLLSLIVTHRLEGNGSGLKETTIGTELFGRPVGYDPQVDSIVRTTAQRLRMELNKYYESAGASDAIVIALPKGHYYPEFTLRAKTKSEAAGPTVTPRNHRLPLKRMSRAAILGLVAIGVIGTAWWNFRRPKLARATATPIIGRIFAYSTSEGRSPIHLKLGYQAGPLIVTPDGKEIYAIELFGRAATVFGADDLQIKRRFLLPHAARGAVISPNGRHIYIGSADAFVMIVDTENGNLEHLIPTGRPVFDLAVTPDEKKVFVALGSAGLKRIDMPGGEMATLSELACPLFLDMDRAGERLFVSYQCGGPGGRSGHDVTEMYDTRSERMIGAIRDLPLVSGRPRVSPDGSLLLLDGLDACATKAYDRHGCPVAGPNHIFYLVRVSDGHVMRSFPRPTNTLDATFTPDRGRLIFGGDPLVVIDWTKPTETEISPIQGIRYNFVAFSVTGSRMFAASFEGGDDLLVFDSGNETCKTATESLVNHYSGDGNLNDSAGISALTASGTITFAPGIIGQAFQFDGSGGSLQGAGAAGCWPCTENWTESFFTKFAATDGEMTLLEREGSPSSHWRHRIFKAKDNRIVFQAGSPSVPLLITSSAVVESGRWYHVALVAEGVHRYFYVDGISQGSADFVGVDTEPMNGGLVSVGASRGKRAPLNGLVDEISWYERALNPREVMSVGQGWQLNSCKPLDQRVHSE